MVGDDQAKALIYARAKILKPGAGYIHFPADAAFDDEYFAQFAADPETLGWMLGWLAEGKKADAERAVRKEAIEKTKKPARK